MKKRKNLVLKENLIAFWIACSIWAVFAAVVNLANNNPQTSDFLQASILSASSISQAPWDISIQKQDWKISIISNVDIPGVETLSYKLKYSENIKLWEISSSYKYSSTMSDTWENYVLITKPWSLSKWTSISTIEYSWNKEEIVVWEIEMILADWSHEIPSINFN